MNSITFHLQSQNKHKERKILCHLGYHKVVNNGSLLLPNRVVMSFCSTPVGKEQGQYTPGILRN